MRKRAYAAAAALLLCADARAHFNVPCGITGPGDTRVTCWTPDPTQPSGNASHTVQLPPGGTQSMLSSVATPYGHANEVIQVWAEARDGGASAVTCGAVGAPSYDPGGGTAGAETESHYRTTCTPWFTFTNSGGAWSCASDCLPGWQTPPPSGGGGGGSGAFSPKLFPNPMRSGRGEMLLADAPANAVVRVYTLSGTLLREFTVGASGSGAWDCRDGSGRAVGSGVYLILIEGQGFKKTLKLAVER